MSFPTSPANGDTAIVNGITYIYNQANNAWKRQALTNVSITNLTVSSIVGNTTIGNFYSYFKRVAVDFGNVAIYNKTVYINDERAQIGARVFVTPTAYTTNVFAQFGRDELEFDNFLCAANVVSAGNIAMYITSQPGPVKGQRNFDYILG